MNELYKLIEEFINSLEEEEIIIDLKGDYNKLKRDKNLINNIKKYQETYDSKLLSEIENNKLYKNIQKSESKLGYIILEINTKLKEINNKGKCI